MLKHGSVYDTEFGRIAIAENGKGITDLYQGDGFRSAGVTLEETPLLKEAARQLEEYFSGKRREFDLPLAPEGTEFQKTVWTVLRDIPAGETRTYGQVAAAAGHPKAARAVGLANNRNPIWILIPCHRVIGANGSLTGYAGGLDMKARLLELEKAK